MDPSVMAAWISSSVALVVAVFGVIASGVAQGRGAKTAQGNVIALFKRQAEEQESIRVKEAIERKRTASLADRRAVYARFLSTKRRLKDRTAGIERLKKKYEALRVEAAGNQGWRDAERLAELDDAFPKIEEAYDAEMEASDDASLALQEIFMLAPLDVAKAANAWHYTTEESEATLHGRFLNAARQDVGAEPLEGLPAL